MRSLAALIADDLAAGAPMAGRPSTVVARRDLSILRFDGLAPGPLIVKIAWSPHAAVQIEREAEQLAELGETAARASLEPVAMPTVVGRGSARSWPWVAQSFVAGTPTPTGDLESATASIAPAIATISRLHATEARRIGPDELTAGLRRIVHDPLASVAAVLPRRQADTQALAAGLSAELARGPLQVGRVHGDYAPANLLWNGQDPKRITAIVDWESSAADLPPEIDLVHFVLATVAESTALEYGTIVARCCRGDWSVLPDQARTALDSLPNGWTPQTAVVVAWAHHVAANLDKAARYRTNRYWLRTNVVTVLNALTPATVST